MPALAASIVSLGVAGMLGVISPRAGPDFPPPWGSVGHEMAARAAISTLPTDVPAFFRAAADQLVWLNPEPDRWRNASSSEMNEAWTYDHYIDFENVPGDALLAPDRFAYLKALYEAGLDKPERDAGFLPFRILEMYERLVTAWRMWHAETDPSRRGWIEERIVNDAGILGHYVTDGAQPHHTTIHFNGWADDAPNPASFTLARDFHARFESDFVERHVSQSDVDQRVPRRRTSVAGSERAAVMAFLRASHETVETLYRLEADVGFSPDGPTRPETHDFTADRLAAGSTMLATLWWSAWLAGGG